MKKYQTFFEKALAIQAKQREKLTEAEKKEIALQLGFTEDDWQAVMDSFEGHWQRGQAFLARNNFKQAIHELEEALLINPEHPEAMANLAVAYLLAYKAKKKGGFKEKALQYAQECLQYNPQNQQAHQVIDEFNPYKISPKTTTKTTSISPKTLTKENRLIGFFLIFILITVGGFWYFASWNETRRPQKTTIQPPKQKSAQQKSSNQTASHTNRYDTPLPFEILSLPPVLAKSYQIVQIDSITWRVVTFNQKGILELKLVDNQWWYPDYAHKKNKTRFYADVQLEVKTLCDSIQFDRLFFGFQVLGTKNQAIWLREDSVFIEQRSTYDRFMYFPKDYFFRKGERNSLFFRYVTQEYDAKNFDKKMVERPQKITLTLQSLKTATPPVYEEKKVEVTNPSPHLSIVELKSSFLVDSGSPYLIHFQALKLKNTHPHKSIKTLGINIKYYNSKKDLIKTDADWLIHNLTDPLPPSYAGTYKLRVYLGENTYVSPPKVILPEEIAYQEIEIHTLTWE